MTGTADGGLPPAEVPAHVLVDDLGTPELADDAWHHLTRVRRLVAGDECTATDGVGSWRRCRLTADGLEVDGEIVVVDRPDPPITVAFALTKGDKPERTVQKLTELGVDRIVAFRAARSIVRWDDDKAAANHRRWTVIARGALEQSRGLWLPEIAPVADLAHLEALGAVRLDRGGAAPSLARTVVAVGPEGGWTDEERTRLPEAVALGPAVLRAETAALTAGGVFTSLRSGLVAETAPNAT